MFRVFSVILGKEFQSYFRSCMAYIIIGIYLFLSMFATFYSSYFFVFDNQNLISFFTYQPEIMAVLIPAVTMRLWADERRSGTIEFLLSAPVSYWAAVMGKFAAACLFSWLMLFLTLPFAAYASTLTDIDSLNIISGYLGCMLVMALFCAVGCLVSAANTNAVLAYLASVFISWLLMIGNFDFFFAPLYSISDMVSNRLSQSLNFAKHYQDLIMGQPGADNLIYFLSLTAALLWLNVAVISCKKR